MVIVVGWADRVLEQVRNVSGVPSFFLDGWMDGWGNGPKKVKDHCPIMICSFQYASLFAAV